MIIDTDKVEKYVDEQRKKYDCPTFGQNIIEAIKTLKECWGLFIEEE